MSRIVRWLVWLALGTACITFSRTVETQDTTSDSGTALIHVTVVDVRTGKPRPGQTVVIEGGRMAAAGAASAVQIPPKAKRVDNLFFFASSAIAFAVERV